MEALWMLFSFALGIGGGWMMFNRNGYVDGYRDGLKFAEQCDSLIELGKRVERANKESK